MKRPDNESAGFTLVELLVAMAILSSTLTVLYSSFQTGLSAYRRSETVLAENREGDVFAMELARELRNAIPYLKNPFLGKTSSISFPAKISRYTPKGSKAELVLVEYLFDGKALVRTERKLRKDRLREEKKLREIVFDRLAGGRFEFLFAAPGETLEWRENWPNQPYLGLPRGVRVTLEGNVFGKEGKSYEILIPHGVLLEVPA